MGTFDLAILAKALHSYGPWVLVAWFMFKERQATNKIHEIYGNYISLLKDTNKTIESLTRLLGGG